MTLGRLISILELVVANNDKRLLFGLSRPHSYRGYYEELAFELVAGVTVGEMLAQVRRALGGTFEGYKGGEFKMNEYTDCWIAQCGREGEQLNSYALGFILGIDPLALQPDSLQDVKSLLALEVEDG